MKRKKITITYTVDDDVAFSIENAIRKIAAKEIQRNGGKSMEISVQNIPVNDTKNYCKWEKKNS